MALIHYVECNTSHAGNFVIDVPVGSHWLLVITKTPAEFWVHGGLKLYPAHNVILYRPQQKSITGPAPVNSSMTGSASNPMNLISRNLRFLLVCPLR